MLSVLAALYCKRSKFVRAARIVVAWAPGPWGRTRAGGPCYHCLCVAACLGICTWALAVPPLSLDGYRNEKLVEGPHESAGLKELNGGCYVCHGNYRTESLVTSHAKEKVGCIQCHGESLPHQVDEFHRTPPEKMYGPHNVDKMCGKCHEQHDAPATKVIQRWQQRCLAKVDPREITCTDCHFKHRLPSRTVVWDKKTGKLVVQKKGQDANSGKSK